MILSTTPSLEGMKIKEYRGVVFGEVVNGIIFTKDFMASITNFTGGRSQEYEEELVNSRAQAISEMISRAENIGANALVGVHVDVECLSTANNNSMLMVTATGTAVVV